MFTTLKIAGYGAALSTVFLTAFAVPVMLTTPNTSKSYVERLLVDDAALASSVSVAPAAVAVATSSNECTATWPQVPRSCLQAVAGTELRATVRQVGTVMASAKPTTVRR